MHEIWNRHKKKILLFSLLLILISAATAAMAERGTLYWGATGPDVSELQDRLRQWGYYDGSVDGVYGSQTYDAVTSFQWNNGLDADGVVGPVTWNALGVQAPAGDAPQYTPSRGVSSSDDIYLLASVIQAEAGDEPYEGMVAVGAVLLNRMASGVFPNTVSGVVFDPDAFESVTNGLAFSRSPSDASMRAAQDCLNGWDPSGGALFFWNPYKPVSPWIWSRNIITQIGNHVFAL